MKLTKDKTKTAGEVIIKRILKAEDDIRLVIEHLAKETGLNISSVTISFLDTGTFENRNETFVSDVTIKTTT